MEKDQALRTQIQQLIANDDLPTAIRLLQELLQNSPQLNEALLQSARLSDISRQIRLGVVDDKHADLSKNQIRMGVLELLDAIGQEQAKPAVQAEVAAAMSILNSKNVVIGNIQAGGDVHIGDKTTTQNAEKIYNIDKIDKADFSWIIMENYPT